MLSGRVVSYLNPSSDMVEMLEKISKLNLNRNEKNLLFLMSQEHPNLYNDDKKKDYEKILKESIIWELEYIMRYGLLHTGVPRSEIIQEKVDELHKLDKEEIKKTAKNLIEKIESSEIKIW